VGGLAIGRVRGDVPDQRVRIYVRAILRRWDVEADCPAVLRDRHVIVRTRHRRPRPDRDHTSA